MTDSPPDDWYRGDDERFQFPRDRALADQLFEWFGDRPTVDDELAAWLTLFEEFSRLRDRPDAHAIADLSPAELAVAIDATFAVEDIYRLCAQLPLHSEAIEPVEAVEAVLRYYQELGGVLDEDGFHDAVDHAVGD